MRFRVRILPPQALKPLLWPCSIRLPRSTRLPQRTRMDHVYLDLHFNSLRGLVASQPVRAVHVDWFGARRYLSGRALWCSRVHPQDAARGCARTIVLLPPSFDWAARILHHGTQLIWPHAATRFQFECCVCKLRHIAILSTLLERPASACVACEVCC